MTWFLKQFKVLGVLFIALVLLGVYLTYATFTKKFTDYQEVTLETSTIGLQLPLRADVKYRGVIVGEVLDYTSTADGADVTLGLYPDQVDVIPSDVTGSILPKTLFGEKFVSLVASDSPSDDHLRSGATIERTEVSIEVEKVLADLYPLLETVEPAQLNMTLNALATALEGRGEALGENLEIVDSYLKRFNPRLPELIEDLRLTADVSDIYSDVLPEVATILDNTITTAGTFEEREDQATLLYKDIAEFSDTARTFLADNETNIIRSAELSAAQLRVFSRYAPEFPCLTGGIVNAGEAQAEAFRGFVLHIVLETLPRQPRPTSAKTAHGSARTAARTACTCPTRRGARATRCGSSRTSTTVSTSPPARAPAARPPASWSATARGTPAPPTRRCCSAGCSPPASASPPTRSATSGRCSSGRWPAARR